MRGEDWGPPRPDDPEWGPRPGRGGDRYGEHGPGWGPGGPGRRGPGGPGGPGWGGGPFRRDFVLKERGFGPGGPDPKAFYGRRGFGRGSRVRKGDVRAAILDLLSEGGQWNGYQLIQEIEGRTSGVWRPSAGSVYPALQQLEDEGLIAPLGEGRRRMFELTEAGRAYAQEHLDDLHASWDAAAGMTDEAAIEFHDLIRQVMMAVMEVRRAGSADQLAQARSVLAQARRSLYLILAEDRAGASASPQGSDEPADDGAGDAEES
ncbi:MAG TPA: PadR family transcriptional regulator [Trebonia sp.]|nr:PadR family transcriptional regulator [Trebonia sp.]